jgi:hypothetical protein
MEVLTKPVFQHLKKLSSLFLLPLSLLFFFYLVRPIILAPVYFSSRVGSLLPRLMSKARIFIYISHSLFNRLFLFILVWFPSFFCFTIFFALFQPFFIFLYIVIYFSSCCDLGLDLCHHPFILLNFYCLFRTLLPAYYVPSLFLC